MANPAGKRRKYIRKRVEALGRPPTDDELAKFKETAARMFGAPAVPGTLTPGS